jgi:predicted MFS family arabinose efflux permease
VAFLLMSVSSHVLPRSAELAPLVIAVIAWGIAHWAFYPAQQTTLVGIAGVKSAPIVLSLNASFMYLGFSLGAALGSMTIAYSNVTNLGYASAVSMLAALALTIANSLAQKNSTLNPA